MKVITEKELIEFFKSIYYNKFNQDEIFVMLKTRMKEIDTLTVSKLRPMADAPRDGEWFLGYYKGVVSEYFEILFYSKLSGKLRSNGDEFNEEDVLGWLPMPIYKPEKE